MAMAHVFTTLYYERALTLYWLLASGTTLAVGLEVPMPRVVRSFVLLASARGKLWQGASSLPLPAWMKEFCVPQAWFRHFYWIGSLWNMVWFGMAAPNAWTGWNNRAVIIFVLLQLHFTRRAYESTWQARYSSDAKMHVVGYLVGVSFYLAASPSLLPAAMANETIGFDSSASPINLIGILVYILGTLKQAEAHAILAGLRQGRSSEKYYIPTGGWFAYVSCPHFTAEILIYLGLVVLNSGRGLNACLLLAWTVANLTIAAVATHRWYLENFENYPKERMVIVPLLL